MTNKKFERTLSGEKLEGLGGAGGASGVALFMEGNDK